MQRQTEADDLQGRRRELLERAGRLVNEDGIHSTAVTGLYMIRETEISQPLSTMYEPSLCLVLQGAKSVTLQKEQYRYDASSYLLVSVHLPTKGQIVEASQEKPYLCVKMTFGADDIWQLLQDLGSRDEGVNRESRRGLAVGRLQFELADAVLRLVRLLDRPADIPVLAPMIRREILYRLLQDEQGHMLRDFAAGGSPVRRIARVIGHIRVNYAHPLPVAELARLANMSVSALHSHFKEVTGMSPLQYQKLIRLQEARRLLLADACDAAEAGFRVGYESPSQFSREYARLFGLPPASDRKRLQLAAQE